MPDPAALARSLLDDQLDAFAVYDESLRVMHWSEAMAARSGVGARDAVGRILDDLFPGLRESDEYRRLRRAAFGEASRSEAWFIDVARAARADVRPISVYVPLGANGTAAGMVTLRDRLTTASRRAVLSSSDQRFRDMADSSPVLLWMAGTDARCVFFNSTWLQFTGRTMDEEIGHQWAERIHPVDFQPSLDTYMDAFARREPFTMVYRLQRHDGEYRWLLDNGAPRFEEGEFVGYIGSCVDITDRKVAEDELREVSRELQDFNHAASHDLKSPARAIHNLAEWLHEDLEELAESPAAFDDARRHLDMLTRRTGRLLDLLDGMLEYSRLGRDGSPPRPVDIGAIVHDVGRMLGEMFPQREVAVEATDLPTVTTAPSPLRCVLQNLLVNAVKHHDRDRIRLRVAAVERGGAYAFTVTDDGPGIAPEHQQQVLQPFRTLRPRDDVEGSGLGLAMCHRAVQTVGGAIHLESPIDDGRGLAVHFTWPIADLA